MDNRVRLFVQNPEEIPKFLMTRPDWMPEEVWRILPPVPFEYPGWCAVLPLPRVVLDKICAEMPAPPIAPPEIPAPPGAADIRVSNLAIVPTKCNIGDTVIISVTAANYSDASGSKKIACSVNATTSEQTIAIEGWQSQAVSFQATPHEAKTYQVSVNGLAGSFTAVEAVPPPGEPVPPPEEGVAVFVYASDVRQTPMLVQDAPWGGMEYEVDIRNTGGAAGSCTAVGLADSNAEGHNEFRLGTQVINPGQTAAFKGRWRWPWQPEEDEWWFKDGGFILSEAGPISFKFGRSVYPIGITTYVGQQHPTGTAFLTKQVLHLTGGRVWELQDGSTGEFFRVGLELRGTKQSINRVTLHALYPQEGDMLLLPYDSDYTVDLLCRTSYYYYRTRGWIPLPVGIYDIWAALDWSYQTIDYGPGHLRPIWEYKIGQVRII